MTYNLYFPDCSILIVNVLPGGEMYMRSYEWTLNVSVSVRVRVRIILYD